MNHRRLVAGLAIAGAITGLSCEKDDWSPDLLKSGSHDAKADVLRRGKEQYNMYCVGCHGEAGDGEGPAARFLDPKPRDFRKGRVKFAAVPAGTMPRDEDLMALLNHGLRGTSMPSWALIAENDKRAIVAYIKTFSEVWRKEAPGAAVPIKPDPFRKKPERGVEEGEKVYHGLAACFSCHPAYADKPTIAAAMKEADVPLSGFRPDLYESIVKESDWGAPIKPPDFLQDMTKFATTKEELAKVIAAGVGGTAMPSWGETLTDKQLWGLAYYVESLVQKRGSKEAAEMRAKLNGQPEYKPPPPPPPPPPPAPEPPPSGSASAGPPGSPSASASAAPHAPPKGK